ncbi:MAG: recombinase family protein [Synechococcales bacterium]|nr:recombinase family protein [Synechococcales bacterium]
MLYHSKSTATDRWPSTWIEGATRSGKTRQLVQQFCDWVGPDAAASHPLQQGAGERGHRGILVFAANGDNRIELADRLMVATGGSYPFDSTTPLGFFQDEVLLFWPLVAQQLDLSVQFPIRLRPETEQELATRLWQPALDSGRLQQEGVRDYYLVRRTLDLYQLAASGGVPSEDIAARLQAGFTPPGESSALWDSMGDLLLEWRTWCLERGLLTYGILSELYWRHLLPHPTYQQRLGDRYQAVFADDGDEYPAIATQLFHQCLELGLPGVFTFNPEGAMRLGLGGDPDAFASLRDRCPTQVSLPRDPDNSLGAVWGHQVWDWVKAPLVVPELPASIRSIQTVSRAELLRTTAAVIQQAIATGQIQPQEVAIIGPGLDAIARYTLRTILTAQGIAVEAVSDQQPIVSSPAVRALLSLMALVYPGLGRLIAREAIAEMLVVLSRRPQPSFASQEDGQEGDPRGTGGAIAPADMPIDPVRAGLIVDHCFIPDPSHPHLLPVTAFPRWDRLGYAATHAYDEIRQWIEAQKLQQQQRLLLNPLTLLDRAIQKFLLGGAALRADELAVVRELMETAQHYWEVDARLRQISLTEQTAGAADPTPSTVQRFIQLLRGGTITADPYPVRPLEGSPQAVTLATIFQYRANRLSHPWQFWLDVGSPLWLTGGGYLFGAPLFLQQWSGQPWSAADTLQANDDRLRRNLLDLLGRATDRVYWCHSDLATTGQEQAGPLISLVHAVRLEDVAAPDVPEPNTPEPNTPEPDMPEIEVTG